MPTSACCRIYRRLVQYLLELTIISSSNIRAPYRVLRFSDFIKMEARRELPNITRKEKNRTGEG